MNTSDARAIIDPGAGIGNNVSIGPFSIIEKDVIIGDNTKIGSHVYLASGTRIGNECTIFHGAVIGTVPQDLKFGGEETFVEIGNRTTIREYATVNRGTQYSGKTTVGEECLIMAYAHIAHDCIIGNNVILANSVNMAGHVIIEDYVGIGGIVPIHQFVRIGKHAFIGGGFRVHKDVPPYILAAEEPLSYCGLNIVGLRRRGFKKDTINNIKRAYKYIYRSNLNISQALEKIDSELEKIPEIEEIINFVRDSARGIIR